MLTKSGTGYCSGAMVNNARGDGRQFFLTAYHCVAYTDTSYHMVGFNYQAASCNGSSSENRFQTAQGLSPVARNRDSDFALFEVQERIPDTYNVFLAGWSSARRPPSDRVVGIHHPSADVKKISFFYDKAVPDCWSECPTKWHWKIPAWNVGTTEPGSSGE